MALNGTISELDRWGTERGWVGPDPYEGLNATRAGLGRISSPLGKRLLIQLVKYSPIDLRRPLGIEPRRNAMSIAHVLAAYVRLAELGEVGPERVAWALAALEAERSPQGSGDGPAWGYHFDVQTRFFFYPAGSPNVIATTFAVEALLDAREAGLAGEQALELALSACERLLAEVPRTDAAEAGVGAGEGAFFGYMPGDRTPIHNASLLVAATVARAGRLAGREGWLEAAQPAVRFALANQRPDGSWPYAEQPDGLWVDGFHTGYVLDALARCGDALGDPRREIGAATERGLGLYAARLFEPDGSPRGLTDSRWPVDSQGAAQGIRTFVDAASRASQQGRLDWASRAWRVYDYAASRLRRRDGAFVFERRRLHTNRVPHVRWVQAPMLDALARLAALRERLALEEGTKEASE